LYEQKLCRYKPQAYWNDSAGDKRHDSINSPVSIPRGRAEGFKACGTSSNFARSLLITCSCDFPKQYPCQQPTDWNDSTGDWLDDRRLGNLVSIRMTERKVFAVYNHRYNA
jgi:hypothetical protein